MHCKKFFALCFTFITTWKYVSTTWRTVPTLVLFVLWKMCKNSSLISYISRYIWPEQYPTEICQTSILMSKIKSFCNFQVMHERHFHIINSNVLISPLTKKASGCNWVVSSLKTKDNIFSNYLGCHIFYLLVLFLIIHLTNKIQII